MVKKRNESLGLIEKVGLKTKDGSIREVLAKVDTGADNSSIDETLAMDLGLGPIVDTHKVKSSHGSSVRPVIRCEIILRSMAFEIEANIKDRHNLKYPMLIGKDIIQSQGFIVDPTKKPEQFVNREPPKSNLRAAVVSLGSTSSLWTIEEMTKYFKVVDNLNLAHVEVRLDSKSPLILYEGKPIPQYDCIFLKGSFRYVQVLETISRFLYKDSYIPFHPSSFATIHDKLSTHLILQENNIPMPATYFAASRDAAKKLLKTLNYPIILKFPKGTQGRGVMFADSFTSANTILDALDSLKQPFIIQEYIDTGGEDVRAIVLGNKVIAAMVRKAGSEEVRSNIHAGGIGEKILLDEKTQALCVRTAQVLKADICAIDLLVGPKGPLVIEANISPGLQGITKATKINVAEKIAEFLYKKTASLHAESSENGSNKLFEELGLNSKEGKEIHSIITNLTLRGSSIVVPDLILHKTGLLNGEEVDIKFKDGEISFKRFLKK